MNEVKRILNSKKLAFKNSWRRSTKKGKLLPLSIAYNFDSVEEVVRAFLNNVTLYYNKELIINVETFDAARSINVPIMFVTLNNGYRFLAFPTQVHSLPIKQNKINDKSLSPLYEGIESV